MPSKNPSDMIPIFITDSSINYYSFLASANNCFQIVVTPGWYLTSPLWFLETLENTTFLVTESPNIKISFSLFPGFVSTLFDFFCLAPSELIFFAGVARLIRFAISFGSRLLFVVPFYCVKSFQIRSYFWSVFSCIRTDWIRILSPKTGKYGAEITSHLDTYHAVFCEDDWDFALVNA